MRKNRIRLTESALHKIIKESVKRVLMESKQSEMDSSWNEMAMKNIPGTTTSDYNWMDVAYGNRNRFDYGKDPYINMDNYERLNREDETDYAWDEHNTYGGGAPTEPTEKGYYACIDTDYANGSRVVGWVGDLKDAIEASHSSEGYVVGPFDTQEEAQKCVERQTR